jgi:hypothetical protein
MVDRELHPEDRFTWERIVLRARVTGLISGTGRAGKTPGRATRGGVSGIAFKAVALAFAAHADEDGSRIFPGDMRVAVLAETSPRTVKQVREMLLKLGLLELTGRHGHRPMYRLTLPDDLTDQLVVLSPDEVAEAAKAMRSKARGPVRGDDAGPEVGGSSGPPTGDDDPDGKGGPPDNPNGSEADLDGWSSGPPQSANGWSSGPQMGGPPDTLYQADTRHLTAPRKTAMADLGTACHPPREIHKEPAPVISMSPWRSRRDAAQDEIERAKATRAAAVAAYQAGQEAQ